MTEQTITSGGLSTDLPREISPADRCFVANMRALYRHDPRLAQRIDDLPVDASLRVQPSRAGPPTALVATPDGRELYLHSRYDPLREARDFCKSLDASDALCVILSGLGLGYHLQALFEQLGGEICVLVSEPDLVAIKTCLEQTDLSKELATGRVELITSPDKSALHDRLMRHSTTLMLGTRFVAPPFSRQVNAEAHAAIREAIMDFAAFAKMSLVTLVRNAEITCRNIANNLPTYLSTPPLDILRDRFRGCPAILVAAGPSLSRNIDQLAALRDRAVIIAAQTTLRPLLARGIVPHFVTSLDFSDMSRQFFEGLDIPEEVVLVAEPKASWHVIDAFCGRTGCKKGFSYQRDETQPGAAVPHSIHPRAAVLHRRVILLDNVFAHRCVGEALARRTPMEPGATVMHLAFYLAQWLGCDPILFIGQDLAFTGHCYYAPGVAMHRAWWPETDRYCTLEMKEWERIVRHRAILRRVKDHERRDIYTDEQMFTYLEQFERDFVRCRAKVIDATEGGACKAGAEAMPLAAAADRFCGRRIEPERFDYLRTPWHDASRLAPAREELVSRLKGLEKFRAICEETRDILRELRGLLREPARFNRRIVRVDELRALVQEHDLIFAMVRDVSQLGELQRFAADRRMAGEVGSDGARAERQLQRDEAFMAALLDGCGRLRSILDESVGRLDAAIGGAA